jgi:hypothetical protein
MSSVAPPEEDDVDVAPCWAARLVRADELAILGRALESPPPTCEEEPPSLDALPDDLLLLALERCLPAELNRIGATCRKLRALATRPRLWAPFPFIVRWRDPAAAPPHLALAYSGCKGYMSARPGREPGDLAPLAGLRGVRIMAYDDPQADWRPGARRETVPPEWRRHRGPLDLTPLAGCRSVTIELCAVQNLAPLAACFSVKLLAIPGPVDLSPLRSCHRVEISSCEVSDVSPLGDCHTVELRCLPGTVDVSALGRCHTLALAIEHVPRGLAALGTCHTVALTAFRAGFDVAPLSTCHTLVLARIGRRTDPGLSNTEGLTACHALRLS